MRVDESEASSARVQELEALVARMRSKLKATSQKLAGIINVRDNLRRAYRLLMEQFELLRHGIFIGKAEHADVTQFELEFAKTKTEGLTNSPRS